ncbi:ATP-binding cassette domain-containing protein [Kibdelosporangium philippinense]|uniref:ATP-binding cassette domain-containing protein n=1 Tax=Kibdelosporangium philippinense TaxID=211113 RepID=A0ABS8Z5H3_9PSEU|nr:ATP-binding cassette domain-containing protein [Kibdelosporangium philippinense]MCE7002293.1 ATP-binding cassette domain-containing protein [Kibdelosporangium philippinense]
MDIEVAHATVRFGGVRAVDDLSFRYAGGGVLGLIGPNGAGKTTLLNVLSGVSRLDSGTITLSGTDIARLGAEKIARLGVARTFQNLQVFDSLSVLDNVLVPRWALHGRKAADRGSGLTVLERVGIAEHADRLAGTLAYGLQRRVELARALAVEPELLLLDEPLAGLSHVEGERATRLFAELAEDGITVVLVEHDVRSVLAVSNHVVVLDHGTVLATGTPDEVVTDPAVRRAYLGEVD